MQRIKVISCLLRQPDKFNLALTDALPRNENPRAGDVVFVRSLSSDGCYPAVENQHGLLIPIHEDDVFVGVIADRNSGYSVSGQIPAGPLSKGDKLGLLYRSGIASKPTFVPKYLGSRAMPLEVLGFARGVSSPIANLADASPIDPLAWGKVEPRAGHVVFVIGTSSECGKTTFTSNFNLAIKRQRPDICTAAIKVCGTGSNRDKRAMLDANYDCAVDFVDCGLATTYEIEPRRFAGVLTAMLNFCQAEADLVVSEIGGDFLEANAPEALRVLAHLAPACVLQVNDAMGALEGLRRLQALGLRPLAIGSFRQNLATLTARLAGEGYEGLTVMDNRDRAAMDDLARTFLDSAFGRERTAAVG
jgi:hypothetical protein